MGECLREVPDLIAGRPDLLGAVHLHGDRETDGESNLGQQKKSIVPSVATSAVVCRSPIRP